MDREVNHSGGLGHGAAEIFARIVGGGDIDAGLTSGFDDGLAHAA